MLESSVGYLEQGCRQGGGLGGLKPPQILTHVTLLQKNVEKQERKNSFQVISMQIEAQKCRILLSLRATNSLATLHIGRLSVLFLWTCSIVHQFSRTCCAVVRSQVFNLRNALKVLSLTALVAIRKIVSVFSRFYQT